MKKILIITDSIGNPRIFPEDEKVSLEETYPYIIKKVENNAQFYQLSYAGVYTGDLINQARAYLMDWEPEVIIVGSGINDSRPKSLSTELKNNLIVSKFKVIKKFLEIIQKFIFLMNSTKSSVEKKVFKKNIDVLKKTFPNSKIYWLEISCHPNYEKSRPGVVSLKDKYNKLLGDLLGENLIKIDQILNDKNLFNEDCLHMDKLGHKLVAEKILDKIKN